MANESRRPSGRHVRGQEAVVSVQEDGSELLRVRKRSGGRRRKQQRRRIIIAVVAVVVVVLVAFAGLFAKSVFAARDKAQVVRTEATQMVTSLRAGDAATFTAQSNQLMSDVAALYDETSGLTWKVVSHVPFLGNDIMAVRKLSHVAFDMTNAVLPNVVAAMQQTDGTPLVASDFSFNAPVVQALCLSLQDNAALIAFHDREVNSVGAVHLAQVAPLYDMARSGLSALDKLASNEDRYFAELVDILGCDSQRNYIIMAQGNSETRATGGFPGQFIPLTIDHGRVEIGDMASISVKAPNGTAFGSEPFANPEAVFTDEEWGLFCHYLGDAAGPQNRLGDLTFMPNFQRVGELFSLAWDEQGMGTPLDGIISFDVPMLQSLVQLATPTITLESGALLPSGDLSRELLFTTYANLPKNADQDDHFEYVFETCLHELGANFSKIDLVQLAGTLKSGAENNHLMAWMRDKPEEHLVHAAGLLHSFWEVDSAARLGVYLNNITWAKSDWFLSEDTEVLSVTKAADGSMEYRVRTTLTNHFASDEEAASYPKVISGGNPYWKRSPSDIVTGVYLFSPYEGEIKDLVATGYAEHVYSGTYIWCDVRFGLFRVAAGETATIEYTAVVPAKYADVPLRIDESPLCGNWD